jgi:hypothetical protein
MIRGEVDPYDQAVIPLSIRRDSQWQQTDAVIDGGEVLIEARP